MNFTIAKQSNYMSFGDLFFSEPTDEENKEASNRLRNVCISKAEKIFGDNDKYETIRNQVENEIAFIQASHSAVNVEIVTEITNLSDEMGYPVCLFSYEAGFITMYLLGVSGVHPSLYGDMLSESEFYINKNLNRQHLTFNLGIAEPIREHIIKRLDSVFNIQYKFIGKDNRFNQIHIPPWDIAEKISNCSDKSGISYKEINWLDNNNCNDYFTRLSEEVFSNDDAIQYSGNFNQITELFSYKMSFDKYSVDDFIKQKGILLFDRNFAWQKAPCVSRIRLGLMLNWYRLNTPDVIKE